MDEFIGSAPPTQLLILMAMPLTGAILFGVFLAITLGRRKKKSQMKLGIPPKASQSQKAPPPPAKVPASVSATNPPASTEDLDLGVLLSNLQGETAMREEPKSISSKKGGLLERVGNRPAETPPSPQPAGAVELLRLLREPQSGQLIVEIAGQRYTKLADITNREIGQYILKLAAHLLAFTNGVILTEAGMKSLGAPKMGKTPEPIGGIEPSVSAPDLKAPLAAPLKTEPSPPEEVSMPAKPAPEIESAFLASLRKPEPQSVATPPKKGGLFGLGGASSAPSPSLPGFNLAEEINEIVQARLRYSPLADTHQIEVTSDLGGGIRIKVNGRFYSSPDDIPNQEIKELIKASIKEWERK
jgi:hypothetical protein